MVRKRIVTSCWSSFGGLSERTLIGISTAGGESGCRRASASTGCAERSTTLQSKQRQSLIRIEVGRGAEPWRRLHLGRHCSRSTSGFLLRGGTEECERCGHLHQSR